MIKLRQRKSLVQQIEVAFLEEKLCLDPKINKAFLEINRELFVPSQWRHYAYTLEAMQLKDGQYISSAMTVAKMTQHLELEGADSVLEIGCGSGFQAAILSKLCRRVFTIERIESLFKEAKKSFIEHEISNVFTRFDDGQKGWSTYAPFDRILFSATAKKIPEIIFAQLAEGGILLAPMEISKGYHLITRYTKKHGIITSESIGECLFVPILDDVQKNQKKRGEVNEPIKKFF